MFLLLVVLAVLAYAVADIRKYTYSSGIRFKRWAMDYWVPATVAAGVGLFLWVILPIMGTSPAELAEPVGFFSFGIVLMQWARAVNSEK